MRTVSFFLLAAIGLTTAMVAACGGDDDVDLGPDEDAGVTSSSSGGRNSSSSGSSGGESSSSSSSGGSSSGGSSSGDAGTGDGGAYPHLYGEGDVEADCFDFGNQECKQGLRCECTAGDCRCRVGERGEGFFGEVCESGNDCGSGACSDGVSPARCAKTCNSNADCADPLPQCLVPFLNFCGAGGPPD